jgi:hypothetical protein
MSQSTRRGVPRRQHRLHRERHQVRALLAEIHDREARRAWALARDGWGARSPPAPPPPPHRALDAGQRQPRPDSMKSRDISAIARTSPGSASRTVSAVISFFTRTIVP